MPKMTTAAVDSLKMSKVPAIAKKGVKAPAGKPKNKEMKDGGSTGFKKMPKMMTTEKC